MRSWRGIPGIHQRGLEATAIDIVDDFVLTAKVIATVNEVDAITLGIICTSCIGGRMKNARVISPIRTG